MKFHTVPHDVSKMSLFHWFLAPLKQFLLRWICCLKSSWCSTCNSSLWIRAHWTCIMASLEMKCIQISKSSGKYFEILFGQNSSCGVNYVSDRVIFNNGIKDRKKILDMQCTVTLLYSKVHRNQKPPWENFCSWYSKMLQWPFSHFSQAFGSCLYNFPLINFVLFVWQKLSPVYLHLHQRRKSNFSI